MNQCCPSQYGYKGKSRKERSTDLDNKERKKKWGKDTFILRYQFENMTAHSPRLQADTPKIRADLKDTFEHRLGGLKLLKSPHSAITQFWTINYVIYTVALKTNTYC